LTCQVMSRIEKLVVVGVGLIGGSFALALREHGVVKHVVGVGRSRENLDHALGLGIIDEAFTDAARAVPEADLVLLAVPVGQLPAVMLQMDKRLDPATVVTDAGSTKRDVIRHARQHLPKHLTRFVPAHPVAGTEHSGAAAAKRDLYRGKRVVLTPLPENDPAAIRLVRELWRDCGASVDEMSADAHDAVFAAVSHLPHALAFALVNLIVDHPLRDSLFSFAASGFRDFTRIASSSPEMWRDICVSNYDALLTELGAYERELQRFRHLLEAQDSPGIEALFKRARDAREAWLKGRASATKTK